MIVAALILLVCITLLILATPHAKGTDPKISVGRWTAYTSDNADLPANPRVRAKAVDSPNYVWIKTAANDVSFTISTQGGLQ